MREQETKTAKMENIPLKKGSALKNPYGLQIIDQPLAPYVSPEVSVEAVIEGRKYRGVLYLVKEQAE